MRTFVLLLGCSLATCLSAQTLTTYDPATVGGDDLEIRAMSDTGVGAGVVYMLDGVFRPAIYRPDGAIELIPLPAGATLSSKFVTARDITRDGTVVVGSTFNENGEAEAFRYEVGGEIELLGALGVERPETLESAAAAISEDPERIVGQSLLRRDDDSLVYAPFIWSRDAGMEALPALASSFNEQGYWGYAISDDGTTIVGMQDNEAGWSDGWVWTATSNGSWLQAPLDLDDLSFDAMSSDGTFAVGAKRGEDGYQEGVFWNLQSGERTFVGIPRIPNCSNLNSISDDKTVAAGFACAWNFGRSTFQGFLYHLPTDTLMLTRDWLATTFGFPTAAEAFRVDTRVGGDGATFFGRLRFDDGRSAVGYVAQLPAPWEPPALLRQSEQADAWPAAWRYSSWLGLFAGDTWPRLEHVGLQRLYVLQENTDDASYWFYSPLMGSLWTRAAIWPWLYSTAEGGWLWFSEASGWPAVFWHQNEQAWITRVLNGPGFAQPVGRRLEFHNEDLIAEIWFPEVGRAGSYMNVWTGAEWLRMLLRGTFAWTPPAQGNEVAVRFVVEDIWYDGLNEFTTGVLPRVSPVEATARTGLPFPVIIELTLAFQISDGGFVSGETLMTDWTLQPLLPTEFIME